MWSGFLSHYPPTNFVNTPRASATSPFILVGWLGFDTNVIGKVHTILHGMVSERFSSFCKSSIIFSYSSSNFTVANSSSMDISSSLLTSFWITFSIVVELSQTSGLYLSGISSIGLFLLTKLLVPFPWNIPFRPSFL